MLFVTPSYLKSINESAIQIFDILVTVHNLVTTPQVGKL